MNFIRSKMGRGLCTEPDTIHHGLNSGYQAIGLAYLMGASRIILLGFDMQHTNGKTHWHGDHPKSLTNAAGIENWRHGFIGLAADLKRIGVEVYNCSIDTALTCFERKDIRDVV